MKKQKYIVLLLIFVFFITLIQATAINEDNTDETDNWELGLVFYDSTVDGGKTPLTEINWDASDGGYGTGESRVITVQINYRNTNCIKTYQPGELEISIPNLVYDTNLNIDNSPHWSTSVVVGANDSTHTGYDWNFVTGNEPNNKQDTYRFQNANTIESKSNFEGNIQIVYKITPSREYEDISYKYNSNIEKYKEECMHNYFIILKGVLNDKIESNEITLEYNRTYYHPWEKIKYFVTKTASKVNSYDGLPENAFDYIWVKYSFKVDMNINISEYDEYPYIQASTRLIDEFPKECIVYSESFSKLENQYEYKFGSSGGKAKSIFVGYPKSIYNEENNTLNIENTVNLFGKYYNADKEEFIDFDTININLTDYEFVYSGELYKINKDKSHNYYYNSISYQKIIQSGVACTWYIQPHAIYTGSPMTLKIGDDILISSTKDGINEILDDNDYFFTNIEFDNFYLLNGNDYYIPSNTYDCDLYVRYRGEKNYDLLTSFKNQNKEWNFEESDGVVGFYFIIKDVKNSIKSKYWNPYGGSAQSSPIKATTKFIRLIHNNY